MTARALRIATRGSPLALYQANAVAARFTGDTEIVVVKTEGDRRTDQPLTELGGRGVFTSEVQQCVIEGRADIAVHSAKDLPSAPEMQAPELVLGCIPERADPRDCLVGSTLVALRPRARVGTGSVRREALLRHSRPDLEFVGLRGNIATRLARVGELDAVVGAVAALTRLELSDRIAEAFDPSSFVPQVGQGAIAVECRRDDTATLDRLALIDDTEAHSCVLAERAFLATLGGGCDAPVGAHATIADGVITLTGFLLSDGVPRWERSADKNPMMVGPAVANALMGGA